MTRIDTAADWERIVHGAASLEKGPGDGFAPHRVPAWARTQVDDALFAYAEACPGGVSLQFETDATSAQLTLTSRVAAAVGTDPPPSLLVVRRGSVETEVPLPPPTVVVIGTQLQIVEIQPQPAQTVRLPLYGDGPVEVLLPHNAHVELIAIEADGELHPHAGTGRRWTHYGSSISQGLNALSVARTWPVAAATRLGWRLRNLSLAGNAQLDGFAARIIRDTPADIITLKVGINLLNADSMRERAFRPAAHAFLDTIREGQPDTPIVLVTALACPIHEDSAGPVVTSADGMARAADRRVEQDAGALTLARSREILAEVAAARADPALTLIDGRELFGARDAHLLYDRLHPNQEGLDLIATRFVAAMRLTPPVKPSS